MVSKVGTSILYVQGVVCNWATGDFTRSLVNDPPRTIWTRELKVRGSGHPNPVQTLTTASILQFAGVSNTSTLYKRGIRICTGTGLGAALSTCLQSPNWYVVRIVSQGFGC